MILPFSIPPIMVMTVDFARNIPILYNRIYVNTPIIKFFQKEESYLSIDTPSLIFSLLFYFSQVEWVGEDG